MPPAGIREEFTPNNLNTAAAAIGQAWGRLGRLLVGTPGWHGLKTPFQ